MLAARVFQRKEIFMKLTDGEKLILSMLAEIHSKLEIKNGVDPRLVSQAIQTGNLWALKWQYSGIFGAEECPDHIVKEVRDFLDMWSFLEEGWKKLSPEDRAQVAKTYGGAETVLRFPGFDGNNESQYHSVADMLINKMGRFESLAGRDLNSHFPSVDTYKRMYKAFEPIRSRLAGQSMNTGDISAVLGARIHPDYRGGGATN
jgi:uncharacterized protein